MVFIVQVTLGTALASASAPAEPEHRFFCST